MRLMLATLMLLMLCVLRLRRLSPADPLAMLLNNITGHGAPPPIDPAYQSALLQAGSEELMRSSVACRWDWGVSACVERAAGTLAEGVVCALKPQAGNWLRCRASSVAFLPSRAVIASCPAHCRAPARSCAASAANVLFRVAQTLRQETDMDMAVGNGLPPGRV